MVAPVVRVARVVSVGWVPMVFRVPMALLPVIPAAKAASVVTAGLEDLAVWPVLAELPVV